MFGIVGSCLDLLGMFNVGCSYIKHLYSEIIHPLYNLIKAKLRYINRLQGTQVMFYFPWENWFSAIHNEEWADACRGLFSDPVGKQNAVQLLVPVNICFFHLITEFLAFQEGLLCCSVESLYFTICLGVISTCDVMSNACELVELLSNLQNRTNTKKMLMAIHEYHGHTLWSLHEARLLYEHESHMHLVNKFSPLVRNAYL